MKIHIFICLRTGVNADCNLRGLTPICSCPRDMTGDPFTSCRPFTPGNELCCHHTLESKMDSIEKYWLHIDHLFHILIFIFIFRGFVFTKESVRNRKLILPFYSFLFSNKVNLREFSIIDFEIIFSERQMYTWP